MVKRIFQQKPLPAEGKPSRPDSRAPLAHDSAEAALGEVALEDLDDLFAAAISRLAQWVVQPPADPGAMLTCVQALRQLHLTAANEMLRREQPFDGHP